MKSSTKPADTMTFAEAAAYQGWERGSKNGLTPVQIIEVFTRNGSYPAIDTPDGPRVRRADIDAFWERISAPRPFAGREAGR